MNRSEILIVAIHKSDHIGVIPKRFYYYCLLIGCLFLYFPDFRFLSLLARFLISFNLKSYSHVSYC